MKTLLLFAALFSLSATASDVLKGDVVQVTGEFSLVAGERNQLYDNRGEKFDCDLLMIGTDELKELTVQPGEELTVVRSKFWHTDWDGQAIPHRDVELSSLPLKEKNVRLMLSCDGSIKGELSAEISKEALNEKLQGSLLFK